MATCVRTDHFKVAYWQTLSTGELYDLKDDPDEANNLWGSARYKDAQAEMMQRLLARMIASVDPLGVHVF